MSEERSGLGARGEEFLALMDRGVELTRELLRENERLRERLARLEGAPQAETRSPEDWERLEEQNHALANLYVASYQLHSTLALDEVLRITIEIVINLIGADAFAIYLFDEASQELRPVAVEGIDPARVPVCALGEGRLGRAVAERAIQSFADAPARGADPGHPLVCIPLQVDGQRIGAISLLRLLQQKTGFSALDEDLFQMLAGHAATAILAARLCAQSERKLSTLQGFIDLLAR